MKFRESILLLLLLSLPGGESVQGDEGMWLFNAPPRQLLRERHDLELSNAWLRHVQRASVRFNSGGSGSFVSPDGLVMSNHHVGADCIQKLGDEENDYLRDGFHARSLAGEKRCTDLELNVLVSIEDVTGQVNAAVSPGLTPGEAFEARRSIMARIERESLETTGLRSDVIPLYQGGKYHLHRFKRYTDVRLVFAPEQQIAFFGGDPDNFEYPRYCLDVCFFRVYEEGQPARTDEYLKWSPAGPREGELIFVSGHPGSTSRDLTLAELESLRDQQFPYALQWLHRLEVLLSTYSSRSEENARRARDDLFGVRNSRKAREGGLAGLLEPALMAQKKSDEKQLREAVKRDSGLQAATGAWDRIATAQTVIASEALRFNLLEKGHGFHSKLFGIARTLVRAAEENSRPNAERLREFRASNLESLELQLFSEEPIYEDLEQLQMTHSLTWLVNQFGSRDPLVQKILAGKSPRDRAAELISQTRVSQIDERRRLYEGGRDAVESADDPMIALARLIDSEARRVRSLMEIQDEIKRQAHAAIANARFQVLGADTYPDATFTLRLSFGRVQGYDENSRRVPFQTTFGGLYERFSEHQGREPFHLPQPWMERRGRLDLNTPFNFVSTADITGGNSGSPILNQAAEVVGLIFDKNMYSLVSDFIYTSERARAVSVHSSAILEALRHVYDARELVDELTGGGNQSRP